MQYNEPSPTRYKNAKTSLDEEKGTVHINSYYLQVCTVWRDSVYSKSVWRGCIARLHLSPTSSATMLPALLHRGLKRVQVLSVSKTQCLQVLLASLPALHTLDLAGCVNLSDPVLETGFTMNLPALTSINLGLCKKVTDNSFGRIGTHCKNLVSLDLGGCTKISNTGLLLLVSLGLPALTHLNLRSCWQLTDAGISHLTNGPNSLPIATLILQDCQKLTDMSLRHISEGLPTLKSLNLSFCASITDSGMKCLARMASLRELNLRFCDNISDIGVSYLSQGSVGLQSLDLSFCDRVTDSAMAHIASGLFNLKSLSLAACRLQDDGVAKISKTLLDLERLSLGQCSRITDRSLVLVGDSMRKLDSLDVYGCTRITSGGLQGIRANLPHTTINTDLWQ